MLQNIIEHFFSALLFLSGITFFELIHNFRRPLILKGLLMLIVGSIGFSCAGNIYCLNYTYNRWLLEFPTTIFAISTLYFYSLLYNHKISRFILWSGISVVFLQLSINLAYGFVFGVGAEVNLLKSTDHQFFSFTLRSIVSVIYAFLTLDLYLKIKKKYHSENIYFKKIKSWSIFGVYAISLQFPNKLFNVLSIIDDNSYKFVTVFTYLLILLFVLFRPKFLNRTNLKVLLSSAFNSKDRSPFSINDFELIFFNQVFYLNSKATLDDFGKIMSVSPDMIGKFIYQNYKTNFSDLVNKSRINYFVTLVSDGQHTNHTIESLALLSGFGSRQSLYKQFKKFHGGNPSDLYNSTLR
jgi:AraC-like DNA-binding protein